MSKKRKELSELHSNKVFEVLSYLDSAELKRLNKFLLSPYFNQSNTLTQFCKILVESIEQEKQGFNRQEVWGKVFSKTPYDDVNFRKYCSDLLRLIEIFMASEVYYKNDSKLSMGTLEFVAKKKIEPLFNSVYRQTNILNEKNSIEIQNRYYNKFLIERLYYEMMNFESRLDQKVNIENISDNLDRFYWIEKLKIFCIKLSHQKTTNYEYNLTFQEEIVQFLDAFPVENVPELSIYFYTFLMLYQEDVENHYFQLKNILDKYALVLPLKEAAQIYDSALHYCIVKANQGKRSFLDEYIQMSEEAINKGVFLLDGNLLPWRYNNVVGVALRVGKTTWAEEFVNEYRSKLPADSIENTYSFNFARIRLYQKKFNEVLTIIRDVEYEDIGYNLISKAMLTISYYELEEMDALDSFLESFRVFLNRHKDLPQQRRKGYLNLIKYVRRLTRLLPGDTSAVEKLRQELIREKATTVNHEWLLEKLAELE